MCHRAGSGHGLDSLQETLRADLNEAQRKASEVGAHLVMIGILPTLQEGHFSRESFSANPRYHLLSDQILAARGEDIEIVIDGVDRLDTTADSIIPEAACTSTQLHLQVEPDDFAPMWNAAQAIAAAQVAVGANSPFLLGNQLWHETRIALFEQATDTRSEELKTQGVRPRVFFGERWITSVFDLFEENVRYFPALLPIVDDEDPLVELEAGRVPNLPELRLHNGTIYRWNRPIYDVADGRPHLRIENRLLPAGPTVVDTMANAALFYGWSRSSARVTARSGPSCPSVPPRTTSIRRRAEASTPISTGPRWARSRPGSWSCDSSFRWLTRALRRWASTGRRDRLLGIIEQRCITGRNGATWLIEEFGAQLAHPPTAWRRCGPRPAVRRVHARGRTGAHLADTRLRGP